MTWLERSSPSDTPREPSCGSRDAVCGQVENGLLRAKTNCLPASRGHSHRVGTALSVPDRLPNRYGLRDRAFFLEYPIFTFQERLDTALGESKVVTSTGKTTQDTKSTHIPHFDSAP